MPSTDPFHILGLHPGAPRDEVRRAYRKLAMRWHPDRNPHAKHAEERFKHIKAAYEIAIDEAAYDAWCASCRQATTSAQNAAANAENSPAQSADSVAPTQQTLQLSLEEAAFGCRRQISVDRLVACSSCAGRGKVARAHSMPCARCLGVGRLSGKGNGKLNGNGNGGAATSCPDCGGRGYVRDMRCDDCDGRGNTLARTVFEVRVPAGLKNGETLRLARAGGSVLLRIEYLPHELFLIDGDDLYCTVPVSVLAIMAGGEIEVPTLDGSFWMLLPALPFQGEIRLPKRGFPHRKGGGAGDLLMDLQPVFPQNLSTAELLHLQQLAAALTKNSASRTPELHDWKQRLERRSQSRQSTQHAKK